MRELFLTTFLPPKPRRFKEEGKVKELLAANSADWTASIRVHINGKGVEPDRARASALDSRHPAGSGMPWSEAPRNK